jgi:hypothetical protein
LPWRLGLSVHPALHREEEWRVNNGNRYDFDLPDRGEWLVDTVSSLANESIGAVVASEVEKVRAQDGSLAVDSLRDFRREKDGPLYALSLILGLDVMATRVWAEAGFGFLQRKSAGRTVEEIARREGITAAVLWALTNGDRKKLHVDVLRDMLRGIESSERGDTILRILVKSLRKWR